jgi:hypothetical protein
LEKMLQRSVENFVIGYNDDTRCEQAVVMTWLREDWGGGVRRLKKERDKRMKGEGHGAWEKVTGLGVWVGDEGGRR